jgi:hypothetical protein
MRFIRDDKRRIFDEQSAAQLSMTHQAYPITDHFLQRRNCATPLFCERGWNRNYNRTARQIEALDECSRDVSFAQPDAICDDDTTTIAYDAVCRGKGLQLKGRQRICGISGVQFSWVAHENSDGDGARGYVGHTDAGVRSNASSVSIMTGSTS